MKTKIFGGIALVAIAAVVALNVTLSNQKQDAASMLALANVEALASEGSGGSYYYVSCGDPRNPSYKECTGLSGETVCGAYYKSC